jgi:hypothetical protein
METPSTQRVERQMFADFALAKFSRYIISTASYEHPEKSSKYVSAAVPLHATGVGYEHFTFECPPIDMDM